MHYSGESAFTIDELYHLCAKFIKEKEGKAFHLSYQDRLQLSAHCKQVVHGPYRADVSPGVGWLDVVGSDRKATWQSLGDLSRERAQEKFVEILDRACPLLGPFLEAHLNEKKAEQEKRLKEEAEEKAREAERKRRLEEELEMQRQLQEQLKQQQAAEQQRKLAEAAAAAEQASLEEVKNRSKSLTESQSAEAAPQAKVDTAGSQSRRFQQEAQIRAALNQQTSVQFRQYAAEQHPGDAGKQEELILQLQEQHFHQYMTQVYQQQLRHQEEVSRKAAAAAGVSDAAGASAATATAEIVGGGGGGDDTAATAEPGTPTDVAGAAAAALSTGPGGHPVGNGGSALMSAPTMWTHKQVTAAQFKANLSSDSDAKLKVGPGEVVTVRVPTHEDGTCIVWEFATDHYDIGFGVYFEWTISPSDRVTVHISESSDEEEEEEEDAGEAEAITNASAAPADSGTTETDGKKRRKEDTDDKAVDEIIPVYRRDCHQEVYCGSHQYPGRGVYLLKFDNSYSLWRSKWLYYRVYYTK